jgi:hypothetical protein
MENTVAIKELFDSLYLCEKQLTPSQLDFIRGVKKQFARTKELSEKQVKILIEIKKYLPSQDARYSGYVADNKKQKSGKIFIVDM